MVYVMSDIHGSLHRFCSIMEQIKLNDSDKLYVLGDVIDRQPFGIQILLELMKMPNVQVLLGNHELMMLNALKDSSQNSAMRLWYRNSGRITHIDYMELPTHQQNEIMRYIRQMPLTAEVTVNGSEYLLVHGTPPQFYGQIPTEAQSKAEFTVWTRLKPSDKMPDGKTAIFGHTPTEYYQGDVPLKIWYGGDKIGIDCGAGSKHEFCRLACLRLDDMSEFYSEY